MRKICVINQKGGVAKTTTTITIAKGLVEAGKRVLIIDLDPQGNIADALPVKEGPDLYNVLIDDKHPEHAMQRIIDTLFVIPARETLTKAEVILAGETARETFLRRALDGLSGFDYVLLDCPPSLGLLNQNALLYADEAIIPTSTDPLGVEALEKMIEAIETINEVFGHRLEVAAIVPTLHDARLKVCRAKLNEIQSAYYEKVTAPVRVNNKLKEAPGVKKTIFEHARYSRGAKDYRAVVDFLLNQEPPKEEETPTVAVESEV